jgi:hypothetical protein
MSRIDKGLILSGYRTLRCKREVEKGARKGKRKIWFKEVNQIRNY